MAKPNKKNCGCEAETRKWAKSPLRMAFPGYWDCGRSPNGSVQCSEQERRRYFMPLGTVSSAIGLIGPCCHQVTSEEVADLYSAPTQPLPSGHPIDHAFSPHHAGLRRESADGARSRGVTCRGSNGHSSNLRFTTGSISGNHGCRSDVTLLSWESRRRPKGFGWSSVAWRSFVRSWEMGKRREGHTKNVIVIVDRPRLSALGRL
jgi:hypothetical protein